MLLGLIQACSVPTVGWDSDEAPVHPARDQLATLSGVVTDEAGLPVEGAQLASEPHGYEAVSAADGSFELTLLPPGELRVWAVAEGMEATTTDWVEVGSHLEISLSPAISPDGGVAVEVLDPAGEPVEGALVVASDGSAAWSDEAGSAWIPGLGGQIVDLEVSDDRYWSRRFWDVTVPEQGAVQLVATLGGRPRSDSVVVGSGYCVACHYEILRDWSPSPHAQALEEATSEDRLLLFESGEVVELGEASATLWMDGEDPVVRLSAASGESRDYEVAGWLGSSSGIPYTELGDEAWPLPVAWTPDDSEREGWADSAPRAWRAERWFDEAGEFLVDEETSPAAELSAEAGCFACHSTGFDLEVDAEGGVDMSSSSGDRWIETGVGCERCHGPASSHIAASEPDKADTITRPDQLDAGRAAGVCGQCHGALEGHGSGLPFPLSTEFGFYEPGAELEDHASSVPTLWPSGAAAAPGQQSDEAALSKHASLACFDCHTVHGTGEHGSLRSSSTDNSLCEACHVVPDFQGEALEAHDGHGDYDPDGPTEEGRCTGCHMPQTAARVGFHELSGSGDLSSHLFVALAPEETLSAFDEAGADTLPPGDYPTHACADCHAYGAWLAEQTGGTFRGPTGDPSERSTHEAFQAAWEGLFP
ncbi:MAG TPA: carboxypeptidase regulatory-like domain-containing protein [Myxococcota bacterium]|nr:carboxypeptidase regulatory-like domain-containing protein [Myxococcota bacterium]